MEREIKFKAWYPMQKTMVLDYANNINHITELRVTEFHISSDLYFAKRIVLLQSTGLKDSCKKEIYECDIVLFENNSKPHIVRFLDGGFKLTDCKRNILIYNINPKQITIIGNTYENPEKL